LKPDLDRLLYICLLGGLIFNASTVHAEVSASLYSGLIQSHNLQIQIDSSSQTDSTSANDRTSIETGVTLVKQSLDYSGGYILRSDAVIDKDISGNEDISSLALAASQLLALNNDWLMRNAITANWYDNEFVPVSSYQGQSIESTLGYLSETSGGTDITLSLKQESHRKLFEDSYKTNRSRLTLTQYSAHSSKTPYLSFQAALADNNADDNSRDYQSIELSANYLQWQVGTFKANLGAHWQQDRYDRPISIHTDQNLFPANSMGGMGSPPTTSNITRLIRKDHLYSLSVQLNKPISQSLTINISGYWGRYDSNIANSVDFYLVATKLNWNF